MLGEKEQISLDYLIGYLVGVLSSQCGDHGHFDYGYRPFSEEEFSFLCEGDLEAMYYEPRAAYAGHLRDQGTVGRLVRDRSWPMDFIFDQVVTRLGIMNYKKMSEEDLIKICLDDILPKIISGSIIIFPRCLNDTSTPSLFVDFIENVPEKYVKNRYKNPSLEMILDVFPVMKILTSKTSFYCLRGICNERGFSEEDVLFQIKKELIRQYEYKEGVS
jgi:hypothetical protein